MWGGATCFCLHGLLQLPVAGPEDFLWCWCWAGQGFMELMSLGVVSNQEVDRMWKANIPIFMQ